MKQDELEQPYWPAGPFKIRLPIIHYRWEWPETIQGMIMFVVGLAMIPLLEKYLGLPYDVALAYVAICGIGFMLPNLLGVPMVPGWITPAIPIVLIFLGNFDAGPDAIKALFALQIMVTFLFFFMGVTGLGNKLVSIIPSSIQSGILLGAGIAAISGEISNEGRLTMTPICLSIGAAVTLYTLFSSSFKRIIANNKWARIISSYGMVPGTIIAMLIGWAVNEYPLPDIKWGLSSPAFDQLISYTPISLGFPPAEVFLMAIPTAIIAYIIAFGDIIVGKSLIDRAQPDRPDEHVEININRVHLVTAIRNLMHSILAPYPGLAGPVFTGVMATVAERYRHGSQAMNSIYGGAGTFWIVGFIALFILPLITLFKPVLPIALSITLLITGFLCIQIAIEKLTTPASIGVAGLMGIILASQGATTGLIAGFILYFLLEYDRKTT